MKLLTILMTVVLIGLLLVVFIEVTFQRKYTFKVSNCPGSEVMKHNKQSLMLKSDTHTETCEKQRECFVEKEQGQASLLPKNNQGTDRADWGVVIEERKQFVRQQCQRFSQNPYWTSLIPSGELWTYRDINYCITPKIGCTFWKRAFRYLAHDYTERIGPVLKPPDIDRDQVHYGQIYSIKQTELKTLITKTPSATDNSFMYTRNPYSRLWSSYIDKFFLPDFWATSAVRAAKLVRSSHETTALECVRNITFEEFLRHITVTPVERLNPHWKPVHRLCDPCHVTFDVIGKQETFAADTAYIVDNFGLDKIIMENVDKVQRVRSEIEMLVEYNFDLERRSHFRTCFKKLEVAKRLWIAFQYNGYIHRSIAFPLKTLIIRGFIGDPTHIFLDTALKTIDLQTEAMKRDLKKQKITMMIEAYRNIPSNILNRLKSIYKYDFLLFQYDPVLDNA